MTNEKYLTVLNGLQEQTPATARVELLQLGKEILRKSGEAVVGVCSNDHEIPKTYSFSSCRKSKLLQRHVFLRKSGEAVVGVCSNDHEIPKT